MDETFELWCVQDDVGDVVLIGIKGLILLALEVESPVLSGAVASGHVEVLGGTMNHDRLWNGNLGLVWIGVGHGDRVCVL